MSKDDAVSTDWRGPAGRVWGTRRYGKGVGINDDINVMGRLASSTFTGLQARGCLAGRLGSLHLWLRPLLDNERLVVFQGFNQVPLPTHSARNTRNATSTKSRWRVLFPRGGFAAQLCSIRTRRDRTERVGLVLLPGIRAAYWPLEEGEGETVVDYERIYTTLPAQLYGRPNWTTDVPSGLAVGAAGWGFRCRPRLQLYTPQAPPEERVICAGEGNLRRRGKSKIVQGGE
eukprot:4376580-Pyramimonas_sp.AAC.1